MIYIYPMKRALLLQRKLHHALALVLVDLARREIEFEWRSLDHVSPNESCIAYGDPDYL